MSATPARDSASPRTRGTVSRSRNTRSARSTVGPGYSEVTTAVMERNPMRLARRNAMFAPMSRAPQSRRIGSPPRAGKERGTPCDGREDDQGDRRAPCSRQRPQPGGRGGPGYGKEEKPEPDARAGPEQHGAARDALPRVLRGARGQQHDRGHGKPDSHPREGPGALTEGQAEEHGDGGAGHRGHG